MLQDSLDDFIVKYTATQLQLHVAAIQTDKEVNEIPDDFSFFFSVFQLQDCIQATLTDWLSSTKLPSEVGNALGFCDVLCYIDLMAE